MAPETTATPRITNTIGSTDEDVLPLVTGGSVGNGVAATALIISGVCVGMGVGVGEGEGFGVALGLGVGVGVGEGEGEGEGVGVGADV